MNVPHQRAGRSSGFTLLEALIAVLVISVGLLGASGLQLISLRSSNQGFIRSQATALANDMAERMRANPAAVTANRFSQLDSTTSALCQAAPSPLCHQDDCNASELARYDFYRTACPGPANREDENSSVRTLLPNGRMQVDCDTSGADVICSIVVSWTEQPEEEGDPPGSGNVALRFQP